MPATATTCWFVAGSSGLADFSDGGAVTGFRNMAGAALTNGEIYSYRAEHPTDKSIWENGSGAVNTGGPSLARTTIDSSSNGGAKVNFAVAPVVLLTPMKRDWDRLVHADRAQGLSSTEQVQARRNVGAAPLAAMGIANVVRNPAVDVAQEFAAPGATLTNNTARYTADMFEAMYNHAAATAVVTSRQMEAASFPVAIPGFNFAHRMIATTAITAPANGDFAKHRVKIEGYDVAHFDWGSANAQAVVVAFQFYSTAAGVALVKLSNSDQSRCFYHEIAVAAGLNFFAFPVSGDTGGTWQKTNSAGLVFEVFTCGKEAAPHAALDAWGATSKVQTTNSGNLLGANNNQTILTGLFIAAGSQLPTAADLPGLMIPFPLAWLFCRRYLRSSFLPGVAFAQSAGATGAVQFIAATAVQYSDHVYVAFDVPMRASPTVTIYNPNAANSNIGNSSGGSDATGGVARQGVNGLVVQIIGPGTQTHVYAFNYSAKAQL